MKRSVLVSGASSGLGLFLAKAYDADVFNRSSGQPKEKIPTQGYELIIHTAHGMPVKKEGEHEYIEKHLRLANQLLHLPHHRFIFISSIDVAAPENELNMYAKSKIAVENLVSKATKNNLIIRPGALLGPGMRKNQLIKVATEETPELTLSPESSFSIVFYRDILNVIEDGHQGICSALANRSITLQEVADTFQHSPIWGTHTYRTYSNSYHRTANILTNELKIYDPIIRLKNFLNQESLKD